MHRLVEFLEQRLGALQIAQARRIFAFQPQEVTAENRLCANISSSWVSAATVTACSYSARALALLPAVSNIWPRQSSRPALSPLALRLGQQRRAGIDFPLGRPGVTLGVVVAKNQAGMDLQIGIRLLFQQFEGLVRIPLAGLGIGAHFDSGPVDQLHRRMRTAAAAHTTAVPVRATSQIKHMNRTGGMFC